MGLPDKTLQHIANVVAETLADGLEGIRPKLMAQGMSYDDVEFAFVNGLIRTLSGAMASHVADANGDTSKENLKRLGREASGVLARAFDDFMKKNVKKDGFVSLLIEPEEPS